ncbi:arylamine N-acetyltransferase [Marinomonas sp. 15G1-11]|uniref:Arylamine N-acetyltransferase n=1 Tax=Marinomonas phaeophyticola TaxID=3004091 RepID=A0ABT4JUK3_9GAMM|nr:arylamine N-acetyltransferase [Marinomonas sp. 15G1-11]MCZ2721458.1 arylamine N-acetyltransferase [Marinomonas sp. 15G1-11]
MTLSASLQNYLADLKLETPNELSLRFVSELQNKHIAKYSFNSLSVVLGETMSLETDDLSHKIVTRGLGGYCFEHNKLTFELLYALGYEVELKLARVLYISQKEDQNKKAPRTHRITLLHHQNNTYLIDTGFGGYGPNTPLLLEINKEQKIGGETYRIVSLSTEMQIATMEYDLQIWKDGSFFTLYRFDLADYSDADCQLGHFYSHKFPAAGFVNNLVVSLKNNDCVIALKNHTFMVRIDGKEETRLVTTPNDLHNRLTRDFLLNIDFAIAEHLFERFLAPKLSEHSNAQKALL